MIVAAAMLLTACVPQPVRVDTPRTEAADKSYVIDLPVGWVKQPLMDKSLLASRDGPLLESILVTRRTAKEAFPKTKKAAADNLLAAELAELEIAEQKTIDEFTAALTVMQNEPIQVAGHEGYRVRVNYRSATGLEIGRVIYGFTDASYYYRLQYTAPKLYYYDRYYPEFEKAVGSFQLAAKK
jgi:hypothetical protein